MEREVNEINGQMAITHYEVLQENMRENISFIHIQLGTGRTHQIRVHFAYMGNSILGDTLYGKATELISRQALHAWKLSFIHPVTKEKVKIKAEVSKDMELLYPDKS